MAERGCVNDADFKVSGDLASLRMREEALATPRNYEEATKLMTWRGGRELSMIQQRTSKLRTIESGMGGN